MSKVNRLNRFFHNFARGIILLIIISSCSSGVDTPSDSAEQIDAGVEQVIATEQPALLNSNLILEETGSGSYQGTPFELQQAQSIQLQWEHTGDSSFTLLVRNLDSNFDGTRFGAVTFDSSVGQSSGLRAYHLLAGSYIVEISSESGSWTFSLSSSIHLFEDLDPSEGLSIFQGKSEGLSSQFLVDSATNTSFEWSFSGEGPFQFSLIKLEPESSLGESDPTLVTSSVGRLEGIRSYELEAGLYYLDIQLANGDWEIIVTSNLH